VTRRVFAWLSTVDACFVYRVQLPLTELNRIGGWDCTWGAPGPDIGDYDVVVGQRLAGPQPDWVALCKNPNVLCVYDADDDLTDLDPENEVPYSIYAPLAEDTRRNIAAADVVTCCVPAAAERLAKLNPNVVVLPICTTTDWIDLPAPARPGALTVGWGGSPFHGQDWHHLPKHLARYAALVPHATFHTFGADYTAGAFGARLRTTGLQPLPAYLAALDLDVGLAPLNTALRGSQTRSHTKALEYAARGIPVVAQACGQYMDWVDEGVNGYLVHDEEDWVPYLLALTDDDLRARMSTAARAKAHAYTIERHIGLWQRTYSGEAA
jgi:hypothetical protein